MITPRIVGKPKEDNFIVPQNAADGVRLRCSRLRMVVMEFHAMGTNARGTANHIDGTLSNAGKESARTIKPIVAQSWRNCACKRERLRMKSFDPTAVLAYAAEKLISNFLLLTIPTAAARNIAKIKEGAAVSTAISRSEGFQSMVIRFSALIATSLLGFMAIVPTDRNTDVQSTKAQESILDAKGVREVVKGSPPIDWEDVLCLRRQP